MSRLTLAEQRIGAIVRLSRFTRFRRAAFDLDGGHLIRKVTNRHGIKEDGKFFSEVGDIRADRIIGKLPKHEKYLIEWSVRHPGQLQVRQWDQKIVRWGYGGCGFRGHVTKPVNVITHDIVLRPDQLAHLLSMFKRAAMVEALDRQQKQAERDRLKRAQRTVDQLVTVG